MCSVDSGIKIDQACMERIAELQKGKGTCGKHAGFLILQIKKLDGESKEKVYIEKEFNEDECKEYCCDHELKKDETPIWYAFRKHLMEYDIAYGIAFVHYTTKDGRPNATKLVYTLWNTDKASIKEKMKYSSTKVYPKLASGTVKHQAGDEDEISYECIVVDKLGRK